MHLSSFTSVVCWFWYHLLFIFFFQSNGEKKNLKRKKKMRAGQSAGRMTRNDPNDVVHPGSTHPPFHLDTKAKRKEKSWELCVNRKSLSENLRGFYFCEMKKKEVIHHKSFDGDRSTLRFWLMFHEAAAAAVSISCFFFIVAALLPTLFLMTFFLLLLSLLLGTGFIRVDGCVSMWGQGGGWRKKFKKDCQPSSLYQQL